MKKHPVTKTTPKFSEKEINEKEAEVRKLYALKDNFSHQISKESRELDERYKAASTELKNMKEVNKEVDALQKQIQPTMISEKFENNKEQKNSTSKKEQRSSELSSELQAKVNIEKSKLEELNQKRNVEHQTISSKNNDIKFIQMDIKNSMPVLDEAKKNIKKLQIEKNDLQSKFDETKAGIAKIENSLLKRIINFFTGEKNKLKQDLAKIKDKLDKKQGQLQAQEKTVDGLTTKFEDYQKSLKDKKSIDSSIDKLNDFKEQANSIEQKLPANIKAHVEPYIKKINSNLNASLAQATEVKNFANVVAKEIDQKLGEGQKSFDERKVQAINSPRREPNRNVRLAKDTIEHSKA
ncbi:hypothetical protein [Enterococcus ratti]|uniref:hypothetical protein n=1 Tax=Enterococcus ratti TaxID=150033 RepID=UPI003510EE7F